MGSLRRNLKGIYTIWLRDVLRFIREPSQIFGALGSPLLYLFVLGGGLSSSLGAGFGGAAQLEFDFRQFVFPGILAMTILFASMFSAISIVYDREFGFLKEVLVAPVSRTAVALGKIAGGSTIAMFRAIIILLLAPLIGISLSLSQILLLLALMLVLAAMTSALGVTVAARQRSTEGFQFIVNFLILPMFFLSGALFPLRNLPVWMTWLSRIDPVTYGVDALRRVALRGAVPDPLLESLVLNSVPLNVAIMFGYGILFLLPAVWLFQRKD